MRFVWANVHRHVVGILLSLGCYLKGKAVLFVAWCGLEGSGKLKFPDFMTTVQDGGKDVSLKHRPNLPHEMLLVIISVKG